MQTNPIIEKVTQDWTSALGRISESNKISTTPVVEGVLTRMVGLTLEAVGLSGADWSTMRCGYACWTTRRDRGCGVFRGESIPDANFRN